jgi:tetratricopeptide (TPR) repeat protein
LRRLEEAIASYQRALEIDPKKVEAHYNMGNTLDDMGRLEDAIASYSRALEIDPTDAATHNNMGNSLRKLGRFEEAIASFSRALEIDSSLKQARDALQILLSSLAKK